MVVVVTRFLGTKAELEALIKPEYPMIYKWLKKNGVKCENTKRVSKKGKGKTKTKKGKKKD